MYWVVVVTRKIRKGARKIGAYPFLPEELTLMESRTRRTEEQS